MIDSLIKPDELNKGTQPVVLPPGPALSAPTQLSRTEGLKHLDASENTEAHSKFAEFHEQYVSKYIQLADAKAGAWFAVVSGVCVYLYTWNDFFNVITHPAYNRSFVLSFNIFYLTFRVLYCLFSHHFAKRSKNT